MWILADGAAAAMKSRDAERVDSERAKSAMCVKVWVAKRRGM